MERVFIPRMYRCKECKTTFQSSYEGEYATCKCGKCAVDQTLWYERHIGGEREEIKDDIK